jgi:hypothetical protein
VWAPSHSIDNFHGGNCMRMFFKFIAWMIRNLFSRLIGSRSFIYAHFKSTKREMRNNLPMASLCFALQFLLITLFVMGGAYLADVSLKDSRVESFFNWTIGINTVFYLSAFFSMLYDQFLTEYEESFTLLKQQYKKDEE